MTNCKPCWTAKGLETRKVQLEAQFHECIKRSRIDVNEFTEFCFTEPSGVSLRQSDVHRDLQQFLTDHPRAIVELPRDHGKSTQVCARLAWELGRDPSLRIKIVCASEAIASERGRFLREAIARNKRISLVFPDLATAQPWTDSRFTIARPANVIGPSVTAIGIEGASTGTRADLLICDDIVDVSAICSRADRERVKLGFNENLMNLLEPTGRLWGLCTPWHPDDLNAHIKASDSFASFRRAVSDDLDPVWPERWSRDRLSARRAEIGPIAFARGYRLVSLATDEAIVKAEWVRFWHDDGDSPTQIVLAVDPAISTQPNADRSAFVVLGRVGQKYCCLDVMARRVSTPDLLDLIGVLDARWSPSTILFESNGAFRGIFELMRRQTSFGPRLRDVTAGQSKRSRIEALSCSIRNETFLLKGNAGRVASSQQELFDEIVSFPNGRYDDLVDAAAMGVAYLVGKPEPRVIAT